MCTPTKNNHKPSVVTADDPHHQADHHRWSRRTFLRQLGIAGGMSMVLSKVPLFAGALSPLAHALAGTEGDRILVLIRLQGGNDGLNTIIPVFDYGAYQTYRPTLALPRQQLIRLTDEMSMAPGLQAVQRLWQGDQMRVVNNVGYMDQNLSHFRSSDIWAAAVDADEPADSGWLGRLLEQQYPDYLESPPPAPPAIQLGSAGNLTFTNSDDINLSLSVADPAQLYEIAQTGALYETANLPDCYYGEQMGYLRTIANATFRYAGIIADAFDRGVNSAEYPRGLGEQLALVARLIRGGLGTRFYLVTLDGFDTHANQTERHPALMRELAESVSAFYTDLTAGGLADRVLTMTNSEFGRRLEQNASGGTDHGAAAPLMMFGPGLNGSGLVGPLPDLRNLDDVGNLRQQVDFRQIYATVLEYWLCLNTNLVDQVLGHSFQRLPELGLDCSAVGTSAPTTELLSLDVIPRAGSLAISYKLPQPTNAQLVIYDLLGRPLRRLVDARQAAGEYNYQVSLGELGWVAGIYICSLHTPQGTVSRKVRLR